MQSYRQRPGTVTAAAVLLFIMGALGACGGVALFAIASDAAAKADLGGLGDYVALLATIVLLLSVAYIVLGVFVLQGANWARIGAIVMMGLGIALEFVDFDPTSFISIAIALTVIGLLAWNEPAKDYFAPVR